MWKLIGILLLFQLSYFVKTSRVPRIKAASPVIFQPAGAVSTDVSSYLLIGDINLGSLNEQLKQLKSTYPWLETLYHNIPDDYKTSRLYIKRHVTLLREEIRTIDENIKGLQQVSHYATTSNEVGNRTRKSLAALTGGIMIGATAVGTLWYAKHLQERIEDLNEDMNHLQHEVKIAFQLEKDNQERLEIVNRTLYHLAKATYETKYEAAKERKELVRIQETILATGTTSEASHLVAENLLRLTTAINDALRGHVTTVLISPTQIEEAMKQAKQEIPSDMALAVNNPLDVYTLPAQLFQRNKSLSLVVPLPLINTRELYQLYQYIAAPLITDKGMEVVVDKKDKNLLLTSQAEDTEFYLELEDYQLRKCQQLHGIYLCPQFRLMSSDKSCLVQLFRGKATKLPELCDFRFQKREPYGLIQTAENTFLATTTINRKMYHLCGDQKIREDVIYPPYQYIFPKRNCSLIFEKYRITRQSDPTIARKFMTINFAQPLDLRQIMQHQISNSAIPDSEGELLKLTEDLLNYQPVVTSDDLRKAQWAKLQSAPRNTTTATVIAIIAICMASLIIVTLTLGIFYLYFRHVKMRDSG